MPTGRQDDIFAGGILANPSAMRIIANVGDVPGDGPRIGIDHLHGAIYRVRFIFLLSLRVQPYLVDPGDTWPIEGILVGLSERTWGTPRGADFGLHVRMEVAVVGNAAGSQVFLGVGEIVARLRILVVADKA